MRAGRTDIDQLRKRLRKRREAAAKALPGAPADRVARGDQIVYRRDLPAGIAAPRTPPRPAGPPVILAEAVNGQEVETPEGAKAFVVTEHLRGPGEAGGQLCDAFAAAMGDPASGLRLHLAEISDEALAPADALLFDLETTGLGNSPVFLIGAMTWEDNQLVSRQFFARSYAEERAILSLFAALAEPRRLLVSFNGKSFDLPYVRTRAAATALPLDLDLFHLDLLHAARRAWKTDLPDCRLQTLESYICGRHRVDDIPGEAIPQAYHDYVRTENAWQMVPTLLHNRLDLITLAELLVKLPAPG